MSISLYTALEAGHFWWTSGLLEQHYYNLSQRITANVHLNRFSYGISAFHLDIFGNHCGRRKEIWFWLVMALSSTLTHNGDCTSAGCCSGHTSHLLWYAAAWWKDTVSLFTELERHQRNEREERRNKPGCHRQWDLLHGCLAWTDERGNAIWQHSTMSNGSGASHCRPILTLFSLFL